MAVVEPLHPRGAGHRAAHGALELALRFRQLSVLHSIAPHPKHRLRVLLGQVLLGLGEVDLLPDAVLLERLHPRAHPHRVTLEEVRAHGEHDYAAGLHDARDLVEGMRRSLAEGEHAHQHRGGEVTVRKRVQRKAQVRLHDVLVDALGSGLLQHRVREIDGGQVAEAALGELDARSARACASVQDRRNVLERDEFLHDLCGANVAKEADGLVIFVVGGGPVSVQIPQL